MKVLKQSDTGQGLAVVQKTLAALYLRGAPRAFEVGRPSWQAVERSLRVREPEEKLVATALRADGLWAEATALETPGLMEWVEERVGAGLVLTAAHHSYPQAWLSKLGPCAPPALWACGKLPKPPFVAIVGSRQIGSATAVFAKECAEESIDLGYSIVSGGAKGCDRAAASGAGGELVQILPIGLTIAARHGLHRATDTSSIEDTRCLFSVCAPDEEFSTGTAMERNALIYAMSDAAIVVHARFKAGGTWHGSIEANRRKLSRLIVRDDPRSPAHRALLSLGALPLKNPSDLGEVLQQIREDGGERLQPKLVS